MNRRQALLSLGSLAGAGAIALKNTGTAHAHSPNNFYQGTLPYDFTSLEGFLSAESVQSHYANHHRPHVDGANHFVEEIAKARSEENWALIPELSRDLSRHVNGHNLHVVYWQSMAPHGGGDPGGDVGYHIETHFGSAEAFRRQFREEAQALRGNGWVLLVWEPVSARLLVTSVEGNTNAMLHNAAPILALDLFEHAYYPDYGHRRDDYIDKFFDVLNWDFAAVQLKRNHH